MSNIGTKIRGLMLLCSMLVVIYVIVISPLYLVGTILAVSAVFGGGVSIYNYGLALIDNIHTATGIT